MTTNSQTLIITHLSDTDSTLGYFLSKYCTTKLHKYENINENSVTIHKKSN